jgi:biofilm protein TabA
LLIGGILLQRMPPFYIMPVYLHPIPAHMKKMMLSALLVVATVCSVNAQSHNDTTITKSEAVKWYKKKEWLNGMTLMPHKSINKEEFARQYRINKAYWVKAFTWFRKQNLQTIAKGKYVIDGDNVFASVTEDSTRDFDKTNWESHRKYIDVQCVITGDEEMGKWPVAEVTSITKPYDETKDVANYTAPGKFYVIPSGTFIIFFPGEAHRPNIMPGGHKVGRIIFIPGPNNVVKKIVIKIRAAS